MKKEYVNPTIEVVELESEDIIRTSGVGTTGVFDGFGKPDVTIKFPW